MSTFLDLKQLLDFLSSVELGEYSFIDGEITSPDYVRAFNKSVGLTQEERSVILKQISNSLKSNTDLLLEAARYKSNRCQEYTRADLQMMAHSFLYFAKYTVVTREINDSAEDKSRVTGLILNRCPLYLMLNWLTCGPLARGRAITIAVKADFLLPSICFAFLVYQAGVPAGSLNVVPYDENKFFSFSHFSISGIIPEKFSQSNHLDLPLSLFQNLFTNNSPSPILILKSADIDSAVNFFLKTTQDHDAIWHPNVIYVEEVVCENFCNTLKHAINNHNRGTESEKDRQIICSDPILNEIKGQGYEVITMFHRYAMSSIIFSHEYTSLSSSFSYTDGFGHQIVSVMPIRTAAEGINLINSVGSLCVSLWCNDVVESTSVPFNLRSGSVWLNSGNYYDPSVPLSLWWCRGIGSFSGTESFFKSCNSNFELVDDITNIFADVLPEQSVKDVLKLSLSAYESWGKTELTERLNILENLALTMEEKWNNYLQPQYMMTGTSDDQTWNDCCNKYMMFWTTHPIAESVNQLYTACNCHVLVKRSPLGIIGILAKFLTFEVLIFLVAGALAYGNTVIVGMTSEKRHFNATQFERLFKPGLVTVITDHDRSLWQQFTTNKTIISVWQIDRIDKSCQFRPEIDCTKVVVFDCSKDMIKKYGQCFEMFASKSKSVWLPFLK